MLRQLQRNDNTYALTDQMDLSIFAKTKINVSIK
jgi:hypothetical protein